MTDLRKLNDAVQRANFPSHWFAQAVREWISMATERMDEASRPRVAEWERRVDPASEPAKVECQNCGEETTGPNEHFVRGATVFSAPEFTCEPAAPSKMPEATLCRGCGQNHDGVRCEDPAPAVASEMPEAVRQAANILRLYATKSASEGFNKDAAVQRDAANALCDWWRSQPAPAQADRDSCVCPDCRQWSDEPATAPVRMTEELDFVLIYAGQYASLQPKEVDRSKIRERVLAVRAQASQPVKLEFSDAPVQAIRVLARHLSNCAQGSSVATAVVEVLHWIDAHEGRVTG